MHDMRSMLMVWDFRKFFGAKNGPPQQQTKLSFSTKAKKDDAKKGELKKEDTEEDVTTKELSETEKGTRSSIGFVYEVLTSQCRF